MGTPLIPRQKATALKRVTVEGSKFTSYFLLRGVTSSYYIRHNLEPNNSFLLYQLERNITTDRTEKAVITCDDSTLAIIQGKTLDSPLVMSESHTRVFMCSALYTCQITYDAV